MSKAALKWHIEKRKVSDLTRWDKNPRKMSEKDKGDLHTSFQKFNYVEIIVIDTDNRIVGGHQRLNEMDETGRSNDEIEVRV